MPITNKIQLLSVSVEELDWSAESQVLKAGLHLKSHQKGSVGISGGQSTQIKYLSKSTDTYSKILLQ